MPMLQVKLYMYQVSLGTRNSIQGERRADRAGRIASPILGIHPLCGNLPPRHQASELAAQPSNRYLEAV